MQQRNEGLRWLREDRRAEAGADNYGVVYFADDDNTYSLQVFEEVRNETFTWFQTQKSETFSGFHADEEHPAGVRLAGGSGWRYEIREASGRGRKGTFTRIGFWAYFLVFLGDRLTSFLISVHQLILRVLNSKSETLTYMKVVACFDVNVAEKLQKSKEYKSVEHV